MSYYTVTVRRIDVLGYIWMPSTLAATQISVSTYDVENMLGYAEHQTGKRELTRDAITHWLSLNAGDFSSIVDFHADIADFDSPWQNEENEMQFADCMWPMESDDD